MNRLIFINTHPIPYFSSLYYKIDKLGFCDLKVWYCSNYGVGNHYDIEFGKTINTSKSILEGHKYLILKNLLKLGSNTLSFFSVINYDLIIRLYKEPKSIIICHGW